MDGLQIKKTFNIITICIIVTFGLLFAGYVFGYRSATKTIGDGSGATSIVGSLKSEISELKLENERLTSERDTLISDLSASNGKLESIAGDLKKYNEDYAQQSAEYSRRIEGANLDIREYNRIYVERVLGICDTMEGTIRSIAETCGIDNGKVE